MADLLSACFVKMGASARSAMFLQNVALALSLVVLMENFARRLVQNRLAGRLAAVILLFCGGLGFVIFFRDYWRDGRDLVEFIWYLPSDYTIREKGIRWGNSLTSLFLTQRSLLLGMPLTLIVLTHLWKVFTKDGETGRRGDDAVTRRGRGEAETPEPAIDEGRTENQKNAIPVSASPRHRVTASFFIGLLAGMLPIVHVHSLAVLFVVTAFLFFFRLDKWREWIAFGAGVFCIAVPELVWMMSGSATRLGEFVAWHFGWDRRGENVFVFWAKNLGLFFPLLVAAFWWMFQTRRREDEKEEGEKQKKAGGRKRETQGESRIANHQSRISEESFKQLLIFYLPFLLIFVVANLVKFAPWEWDNIKLLIYWFVASVPAAAWLLARLWEMGAFYKLAVAVCLLLLTFSGAIDIWRVVSRQINVQVFSRDSVEIAEQIKEKTDPRALFLNAPTYNSAVVLSGRRSLMRYAGHLQSYGIDFQPREWEVKRIYEGTALAEILLKRHGIDYVLISPEERANLTVNEEFFSRYPVVAEIGEYRVYRVKK
jgi:hypothetical protein